METTLRTRVNVTITTTIEVEVNGFIEVEKDYERDGVWENEIRDVDKISLDETVKEWVRWNVPGEDSEYEINDYEVL